MNRVVPPELARLQAKEAEAEARAELARTEAIPDVTWGVGVRKFGFEEDVALVGSVSIPLGSAARSDALTAREQAERRRIQREAEALRQVTLRNAVLLERRIANAASALERLDEGPIVEARRALDLATDGYERGAFSYLDIIDARSVLFDLRERRIEFLSIILEAEASLARLGANRSEARLETLQ